MTESLNLIEHSPVFYPFLFVMGLIWGSFYNVCIFRLPASQSLWRHRSRCLHCSHPIPWWQNIPVLSFLALKGKCAYCARAISIQYPLVELFCGALFVATGHRHGFSTQFFVELYFLSTLLIISVIDIHHRIIPDELSLSGIVIGIVLSLYLGTIAWQDSVLGAALGGGVLFLVAYAYEKLAHREGLGGGDVKMLAMIGAWYGYRSILPVIVIASTVGSIAGFLAMWRSKEGLKTAIPFGPFLALGAVVFHFLANEIEALLYPAFYP